MNKVLIPVDFSDTSSLALSYAVQLFGDSDTEVTILHTYQAVSGSFTMKSLDNFLEKDSQREMESIVKKLQEEYPSLKVNTKIIKGNAVSVITSLGDTGDYDYIVMGTKGASGLKEVFIGSVAGGVIANTKAAVLVVPASYNYRPLQKIVFAVGDSMFSSAQVVDPLKKLAKMSNGKVNVLHVGKDKKPDLSEMLQSIEDLNPEATYTFGTGDVNDRLSEYLQEVDADLLCLVRSKKDFFSRLFNESVTLKQTFHSPVPLLILHS